MANKILQISSGDNKIQFGSSEQISIQFIMKDGSKPLYQMAAGSLYNILNSNFKKGANIVVYNENENQKYLNLNENPKQPNSIQLWI